MLKKSMVLACFSVVLCGAAHAEDVISITSTISVNSNDADLLDTIKEYSRAFTHNLVSVRGVTEVETMVDSDCGSLCKREIIRCSKCGSDKIELISAQTETKCACGKPVNRKCNTCGCSSCSSCCK